MNRAHVELLTRAGCGICERVHGRLAELADELDFDLSSTDVDAAAAAGDSGLRAEFGDRLPVVLLDGRRGDAREADAVAAHHDVVLFALLV